MNNPLYQMMIRNAAVYARSFKATDSIEKKNDQVSIFEIASVLAIVTGKLKEDIVVEISNVKLN